MANVEADLEKNENEELMISRSHIQYTLIFLLIDLHYLLDNAAEKDKIRDRIIELIYEHPFIFMDDIGDLYDKPKENIRDFVINHCINIQDNRSIAANKKLEYVMNKMLQST